jgi:RNA polymerase sigma-70 factor (ECF subfamily)
MLVETADVSDQPGQALEDLMAGYQAADASAAAELIRQVSPLLFRYLSAHVESRALAEDLLQECWLRIHRARHTYRPGQPVLPWVYAIARHTRVDGFRRRRRIEWHEVAVEQLPDPPVRAEARRDGNLPALAEMLRELPDSQRDVIVMLKVSGMTLEEVARATGTTVGAVKQKAHRAYEKLRQKLGEVLAKRGEP